MFFKKNPKGFFIFIKVKASAKKTYIKKYSIESSTKGVLKISLQATPEKGAANKALIKFLAQEWNIPQKDLSIIHGITAQSKTILIKKDSTIQEADLLLWAQKKELLSFS